MDTSSARTSLSSTPSGVRPAPPSIHEICDLTSYELVKRALDVILSLLLLSVLWPILLFAAICVRMDSGGPIIFRQQRVGREGKVFVLYKLRTMVVETPTLATDELKRLGKSYYTKVGLILRRLSLDELPQLWNVLAGDMSLIGPRPALPSQDWLNAQRQLFRVQDLRPGITGLAQVSGRDRLSDFDKVAFDAQYRASCGLSLDCRILLATFKAVFTGNGAN